MSLKHGVKMYRSILLCLAMLHLTQASSAGQGKVGLVLGGGGARGVAHVGVLKVLEQEGIAVDYIAGTSMGAIVGALYASGYSAAEIEAFIATIDWNDALTDVSSRDLQSIQRKIDERVLPSSLELGIKQGQIQTPQGLIQGQHLNLMLRKLLAGQQNIDHFDQLSIPFRAVACDIATGEAVILESGDLVESVRASMSVPGVFQPVKINGRLLVDGGVVDNVPVQVAQQMGADLLIVVDVGSPLLDETKLNSPLAVTEQVFTVLTLDQTKRSLARMQPSDLLIQPTLGDINSAQFDRSLETIPLGEQAAIQLRQQLAHFKATPERLAQFQARHVQQPQEKRTLVDIQVNDGSSRTASRVANYFTTLLNQQVTHAQIEQLIAQLYGEGRYEKLTYRLEPINSEQARLLLFPVDKHWGPHFMRMGLKFSDNLTGDSAFQIDVLTRIQSEFSPTAEWRLKLGLGDQSELGLAWHAPMVNHDQFYLKPYVNWRAFNQRGFTLAQQAELARFRWNRGKLGLQWGYDFDHANRLFAQLETGRDKLDLIVGPAALSGIDGQRYGTLSLGYIHDSLDHASFPTQGSQFSFDVIHYAEQLGTDLSGTAYHMDWKRAFTWHHHKIFAGLKAATTSNDELSLQALNFLGGLGHLSGLTERQIGGTEMFLTRLVTTRELGQQAGLLNMPLHLGFSLEAGNVWGQRDLFDLDDLIYSGSVFLGMDTPLGPLFLGYGRTNQDQDAIYLQFGSLLNQTER